MTPRLRFAPSPTGYLHVGGARTALFNWLYARRHGGTFILRIEDTDVERSQAEMVTGILDGLRWLGIDWDEGPEVGGPHAPYFQSERLDRYRAAARQLLDGGQAYEDGGAIRFKVPLGKTAFTDAVHGPIEFDNEHIESFVILRSDTHPTYHLSVVVDDIDMAITHVVRGDDHISNTPKQVLLYQAFGQDAPAFAHVPLIMGPDKQRLSKRHGATSVMEYQKQGYIPEAMVNFLALLGWGTGSNDELFTTAELVQRFNLEGISGGNAVFNTEKLDWFNQQHLLRLPDAELIARLMPFLDAAGFLTNDIGWLAKVLALLRPRCRKLTEFVDQIAPFFVEPGSYDPDGITKHLSAAGTRDHLAALRAAFADAEWTEAALEKALRDLAEALTVKAGALIQGYTDRHDGSYGQSGTLRNARVARPGTGPGKTRPIDRHIMNRRDFLRVMGSAPLATRLTPAPGPKPQAPSPHLRQGSGGQARSQPPFDFIVVGAGSSGCVLANRLSADAAVRVLLLEAGGPPEGDPAIATPGKWVSLIGSKFDWGYATEPEPGLQNRRITFPRGKVHGGSSAINAMTFIRGHQFCFDRWERAGNAGWGYDALLPLFKMSERHEMGETPYRGAGGPLAVSLCTDPHAGHKAFLGAAAQHGYKVDARQDFNIAGPINIAGYYQKTILDGKRHSVADAFLTPALSRPNLEVRSRCQATRLVIERGRAVGVEYMRNGKPEQARASREVVLSGGVIDTPKLLLLSGIGPADHLKALGIGVTADVPGVGRNFQDHLKLSIRWAGKTELPGSTVTAGMFTRSDPSAWSDPPDLQFYVGRGAETPDTFITITVSHVWPKSRGEVRLRSADPLAPPIIRANYLQEEADVTALVRGVKLARWFGEADSYAPLRGDELLPGPAAKSDADLAAFARRESDTIYHGAGTCKMGPAADAMAVVDPSLRVRGVEGLRVADASIMPEVVNAPTNAASVMIGEKAAMLIQRA